MATRMNLGKWRRRKPDPGSIEMPCRCGEGMKPNTLHSLAWCALLAGGPRRRSNAGSPRRLHHYLRYGGRCWDRECDPGDEKRTDGVSRGAVLGVNAFPQLSQGLYLRSLAGHRRATTTSPSAVVGLVNR